MLSVWRHGGALEEGNMPDVPVLAIDRAKRRFQICATDQGGTVLLSRTGLGRVAQSCSPEVWLLPPTRQRLPRPRCAGTSPSLA